MSELDNYRQLQSLMMGYDHAGLYWCKHVKMWSLLVVDDEREILIMDKNMDNLINILLHSDL